MVNRWYTAVKEPVEVRVVVRRGLAGGGFAGVVSGIGRSGVSGCGGALLAVSG
jgi:hypothetical protein